MQISFLPVRVYRKGVQRNVAIPQDEQCRAEIISAASAAASCL